MVPWVSNIRRSITNPISLIQATTILTIVTLHPVSLMPSCISSGGLVTYTHSIPTIRSWRLIFKPLFSLLQVFLPVSLSLVFIQTFPRMKRRIIPHDPLLSTTNDLLRPCLTWLQTATVWIAVAVPWTKRRRKRRAIDGLLGIDCLSVGLGVGHLDVEVAKRGAMEIQKSEIYE
jgi:hypothetical protein